MARPRASKTRLQIRQAIGYNLDAIALGVVTSTGDATSLIDTYVLGKGGDREYVGRQIQINTATQSTIVGTQAFITSFNSADGDATITTLVAVITKNDTYEMWKDYTIEAVNNKINEAIISATDDIFVEKETHSTVKEVNKYAYDCLSSFAALYKVEYVYNTKINTQVHACDTIWDNPDGDVTATVDTTLWPGGSNKFVVDGDVAAGDFIATDDFSSINITDCDELVFDLYSTTALDAADLDIMVDNTAQCGGTPLESIDVPATTAYTKTRHVVSLANPSSDSAIISVGLTMTVEKGAFTVYIKNIRAQNSKSRIYHELSPNLWSIVQASTPLLKLSEDGHASIGNNELIRLTGFRIPAELSSDTSTTTCDIDPDFVITRATALCLMSKAGGREIDPEDRRRKADWFMAISEKRLLQGRTQLPVGLRWV